MEEVKKYRIVEVTYENDYTSKTYYVVQKLTRIFWIGPKIWETYQEIYDGNWCSHTGWTWFINLGDRFSDIESAKKILKREMELSLKITNVKVVENEF